MTRSLPSRIAPAHLASFALVSALLLAPAPHADAQTAPAQRAVQAQPAPVRAAATPALTGTMKSLAPAGVTTTRNFDVYVGAPTQIAIPFNRAGQVTLAAQWQGPELVLRLQGPGGLSQEARGTGSVSLSHNVTAAEASANALWMVWILPGGAAPPPLKTAAVRSLVRGTLSITAPAPDPVAASTAFSAVRKPSISASILQRMNNPVARSVVAAAPPSNPPAELVRNFPKGLLASGLPGKRDFSLPKPHIDRVTLCQPDYYPNGPFRNVETLPNPMAWVMLHGSNFAGVQTQVFEVPHAGSTDARETDPYNGLGASDSLLSICIMAGSNCWEGNPDHPPLGEIFVKVNGAESNRVPFRFPGMMRFYYVLIPDEHRFPTDVSLGGDNDNTSTRSAKDLDSDLQVTGFDWPANTTTGDAWRSEEMREFWNTYIVTHDDKPHQHSGTFAGHTVSWTTSSSDRGTDTFFLNTHLGPGYQIQEVKVDPVLNGFNDLISWAIVAEDHPGTNNAMVKVNWGRAPAMNCSYRLTVIVRGPEYCPPGSRLVRP